MNTTFTTNKRFPLVEVPAEYQEEYGCIAFQLVEFNYSFYGSKQCDILDTKILKDGTQVVVDGNGFIKYGTVIN